MEIRKDLIDNGYQVDIVDVYVPPQIAYKRMIDRFVKTGRLLVPEYMRMVGTKPSEVYDAIQDQFRYRASVDNSILGPERDLLHSAPAEDWLDRLKDIRLRRERLPGRGENALGAQNAGEASSPGLTPEQEDEALLNQGDEQLAAGEEKASQPNEATATVGPWPNRSTSPTC
jgi:hypothetical protein